MSIHDDVQAEVDAQTAVALARLESQRVTAQKAIDEQVNTLNHQEQALSDDFIGFRKGLRPPAYSTDHAGVLSFDPLMGSGSAPALASANPLNPLLLIGLAAAAYWYFKKGRK